MLPERLIRLESLLPLRALDTEFAQARANGIDRKMVSLWQSLNRDGWQLRRAKSTLTGDAWRTAWAEAHDAATDAALDAVY